MNQLRIADGTGDKSEGLERDAGAVFGPGGQKGPKLAGDSVR